MNLAFPTGPVTQALGWALLHLVWQGALISAVLAVLLPLLSRRSANLRYAVSCVALAMIVVLGVASGVRSYRAATSAATTTAPAMMRAYPQSSGPSPPSLNGWPRMAGAATVVPRTDRVRAFIHEANAALPAIVMLWLAGVALFSVRLVFAWLRARRLLTQNAARASRQLQAATHRLSLVLGVRHVVRVLESTAVDVPSVIGLMRPAILLPATTLTGLLPSQLEMILAHELAHIRRHDFLVNLLQAVVETLLFYHPAVWWISQQVRIERENCCDDLAVAVCGDRLQYARALLRLEELRAPVPVLAVSANGGTLFERIHRIATGSRHAPGHAVRAVAALAALSCVLIAIAAPSFSSIGRAPTPLGHASSAIAASPMIKGPISSTPVAALPAIDVSVPDMRSIIAAASTSDDPNFDADVDPGADAEADLAPESDGQRLSLDELINLRAVGVTPADIRELRSLFPRAKLSDISSMKAVGATPAFVRAMRRAGLEVRSPQDAQGLAAVGVTEEFIRDMRSAGLPVESAQEAQGLAAVGVTPEFVDEMRSAGLAVQSSEEAQGLAAVGVTPRFIREMRSSGLTVESAQEAQGLAAVGVTAKFIRELRATGLAVRSAEEAQGLAAVGVTPDYVRELRDMGVEITGANDVQSLRALGVTAQFVRRLAHAGYTNLTVQDLERLAAAGVTDGFIREMSQYRSQ